MNVFIGTTSLGISVAYVIVISMSPMVCTWGMSLSTAELYNSAVLCLVSHAGISCSERQQQGRSVHSFNAAVGDHLPGSHWKKATKDRYGCGSL